MSSINWQQLKVYKTLLSPSAAVEHRVLPSLTVCLPVCVSVANIWKPKSNKFYGKNDFVHLAPGYLPFLFDISSSTASPASCCLGFIQFYCVITLNWLKIGCKRFKALSWDCKVFRNWKYLAAFSSLAEKMQFSSFHTKLASCSKLKRISLCRNQSDTPDAIASPQSVSPFPFPFPFATCVFWFPCCLVSMLPACFVRIVISSYEINMSPPRDISVVPCAGLSVGEMFVWMPCGWCLWNC